jgi:hypothetical protein
MSNPIVVLYILVFLLFVEVVVSSSTLANHDAVEEGRSPYD